MKFHGFVEKKNNFFYFGENIFQKSWWKNLVSRFFERNIIFDFDIKN